MPAVFNEWLNANSLRKYPLIESGSQIDVSGTFAIPNSFIVSMQVNVPRSYVNGVIHIKEVGSFTDHAHLVIGFYDNAEEESYDICKVSIDFSTHTNNSYYPIIGSGEHYAIVGSVCIGDISELLPAGTGVFEFSPSSTGVEPSCIFVSVPSLTAVEIYNGENLAYVANDILRLKAGENIRLTYVEANGDDEAHVRIDAEVGANVPSIDDCGNLVEKPQPIRTINGIPPDENGNFSILGSECLVVSAGTNSISVSDICSQSCCGCTELEQLTTALAALRSKEESLRTMIQSVESLQAEMIAKLATQIV